MGKDTPEGIFLELVSLEANGAKKVALLEQFLVIFPACDPSITVWVYGELQDRYRKTGALDKALTAGEKILALDPDNIEIAETNRSIAEKKGDNALVNKWDGEVEKIAERVAKLALPSDPADMKAAQERLEHARQLVMRTEYEEYTKALQTPNPTERIAALEAFVKKSPQTTYLEQLEIAEFNAYKELGDFNKTVAFAEKILSHDENRVEALLFLMEVNYVRKKDPKRTLALASKFLERMAASPVPEGVNEREWNQAKTKNVARAHYIIGRIYFESQQWPAADHALRTALPLIGDEQLRSAVLNDLGWANYQMQSAVEAVKFYNQCAAIRGPLQEQAAKSALSIKAEYHLP